MLTNPGLYSQSSLFSRSQHVTGESSTLPEFHGRHANTINKQKRRPTSLRAMIILIGPIIFNYLITLSSLLFRYWFQE